MLCTFRLKRLVSVSILYDLHDLGLSLASKLVDFLFEFGLIHKMIVILHWKVPFLDYLYLFIFIQVIRFFIDLYSPIFIDDWLNMHLFNMIRYVRIMSSAHHAIDLFLHLYLLWFPDEVFRSNLLLKTALELLFATCVVIDSLNGPFRWKVRGIYILYTI